MGGPGLAQTGLRSALWLLLGGWIGAWLLFGLGVTTTAFRVLPSSEVAGQLVGPILAGLHLYGVAAGVALAGLALALRRGAWLAATPLALGALCLYSELAVTGEIARIRAQAFGPEATLAASERFGVLHRRSLAIFIAVGLGAIALLIAHVHRDTAAARGEIPPS